MSNYTKICSKCKIEKDINNFHFNSKEEGTRKSKCKDCQAKYIQSYKAKNPDKVKDIWRKASRKYINYDIRRNKTLKKYGLDLQSYNNLFDKQNGGCKICGDKVNLCVDHNHKTGKIRGLLCNGCNRGIGFMKENISNLEKAILYLKENNIAG